MFICMYANNNLYFVGNLRYWNIHFQEVVLIYVWPVEKSVSLAYSPLDLSFASVHSASSKIPFDWFTICFNILLMVFLCFSYVTPTSSNPAWGQCQPLTIRPPPAHPCNVVFNLKSPLGDTKQNNFSPASLCSPTTESWHFYYCDPISKVKQRIFSYKELVNFVNN